MQTLGCKVFFIGFNKCGTMSLHRWLKEAGIESFHGGDDAIDCHTLILANIALSRPALDGLDQYDAYLDVRAVQEQFRALDRDYPGSKFVLNTRNVDRWIVSRLNHLNGSYVTLMNLYYGVDLSWSEWVARWRRQFTDHENAIDQHFGLRRDRDFLRFDVEADRPSVLAAFLGLENAADELPRENVTPSKHFGLSGGRVVAYTEASRAALERDEALVQRDAAVAERDAAIAERDRLAAERVVVLAHRDGLMEENSARKAAYEHLAAEVDRLIAQRDEIVADRGRIIAHGERLAAEVKAIAAERAKLELELGHLAAEFRTLLRSRSWRITAPLRGLVKKVRPWAIVG